jgi:hypothetical protein
MKSGYLGLQVHHGEPIDWDGWLIGETNAARHLVKDPCFEGIYYVIWDSEGFGDAIWFDTIDAASAFIQTEFPLPKSKKDRAKQTKYMPIAAEKVYRLIYGLRRIVNIQNKIAVVEESTSKVVDDNFGIGYNEEEEAWKGFSKNFSKQI